MKIAFLISTLGAGGAERVCTMLCNEWSRQGCDVHLLTFLALSDRVHYQVDERIVQHRLDLLSPHGSRLARIGNNLRRAAVVRRVLHRLRPDVVVCFMTESNVVGVVAGLGLGVPVFISERVHPAHHAIGRVRSALRWLTYRFAHRLVVQTDDIARWCEARFSVPTAVIVNPLDVGRFCISEGATLGEHEVPRRIIAVGRLERQKGFDVLLDAFAQTGVEGADWQLVILGEGPQRLSLEQQREQLGLQTHVLFPGVVDDVAQWLRSASIFVSASRYEGFPNAIAEALAARRCVVASDAPGATRDILGGGEFGLLVPPEDAGALAAALRQAMGDEALRNRLAARALQAVRRLDLPEVAGQWLRLFGERVHKCQGTTGSSAPERIDHAPRSRNPN